VRVVRGREAGEQRVGKRNVDEAFSPHLAIVADRQGRSGSRVVDRRVGDDVDRAAEAVAAVQGALRAAQHLHPVDVDESGQRLGGAAAVDAVDEEADDRIGLVADALRPGAADRRARIVAGLAELEPGGQLLQQ
jgi:hypothetical protein